MELGPGEPVAGPWAVEPVDVFARSVAQVADTPVGRPRIVAVDGRGGGGKTALAARLGRQLGSAAVVHSDDVAWAHSRFGWDDLMIAGILEPLRSAEPVHYRPSGWDKDGRCGHIDVAAGLSAVIIEGVGVSRRRLAPLLDVVIWVQSDFGEAKLRGLRRDMDERAHFIVGTASSLPHDQETEVVSARARPPVPDSSGGERGVRFRD